MKGISIGALLLALGGLFACDNATPTNGAPAPPPSTDAAPAPQPDTRTDPQIVADYARWAVAAEANLKAADEDYRSRIKEALKNSSPQMARGAFDNYQNEIDRAYYQGQPFLPHLNVCDADASMAISDADDALRSAYQARTLIIKGAEDGNGSGNPTMAQVASLTINSEDIDSADRALEPSLAKAKKAARSPKRIAASCM